MTNFTFVLCCLMVIYAILLHLAIALPRDKK